MKTFAPLFLACVMILSACLPLSADPYTLQAQGQNALNVAYAQMTATAEAAILAERAAILQQAQTQAANDNQATATSQAMSGMQTATSQAVQSTQTQIAVEKLQAGATATQSAMATRQVIEATATQHAADLAALALEREQAQLQREIVTRWVLWGLLALILTGVFLMGAYSARKYVEAYERQQRWIPGAETFYLDTAKGPVLSIPRRMFGPGLTVDHRTQTLTMPMLTDPALQLQTTLAALAVELQREASKQLQQLLYQTGHNAGLKEIPTPVLPATVAPKPLPMINDRHIMIAGPTGSGKTHTARYLLQGRQNAFVLDPHHKPGEWPEHCQVVGGGRNFPEIGTVIENTAREMDTRYKSRAQGKNSFEPITLITDEVPALAANLKDMMRQLMQIAREGRKVNIFLFLLTQSVLVKELGIEGHGEIRHNFATIKLSALPPGVPENTPRTAHLMVGELRHPEIDELCLVPAVPNPVPKLAAGVPSGSQQFPAQFPTVPEPPRNPLGTGGNRPEPGSQAEKILIQALRAQGFVSKKIAALLGGRTEVTLDRVHMVLGEG